MLVSFALSWVMHELTWLQGGNGVGSCDSGDSKVLARVVIRRPLSVGLIAREEGRIARPELRH